MLVTYGEKAKTADGFGSLQQATQWLEEIVGQRDDPVTAEWDRAEDAGGHAWFTLTLSDFTASVRAQFAREELPLPKHIRMRLRDLWGDLLQARSNAQVKKLQELVKEGA